MKHATKIAVCGLLLSGAAACHPVHDHHQETGEQLSGMFYGVRNFMSKAGISIANLVFPSLLLLGKSTENAFGVQLSALVAVVFCLVGWWFFRAYNEVHPST